MTGLPRLLAGLTLFGASFGFVEAAVVVDLRAVYEPLQRRVHPATPAGALFPLLRLDRLARESPAAVRLLALEVAREAGTIAMLAAVGLIAGGPGLRGFAAFVVAFGLWDVFYYASLYAILGWPATVWEWDLLFLIPVPWAAPVAAPLAVAATMVVCGVHTLARGYGPDPLRPSPFAWSCVGLGGLAVFAAFCWDFRRLAGGGLPGRFPWHVFGAGLLLAVAAYAGAAGARVQRPPGESRGTS